MKTANEYAQVAQDLADALISMAGVLQSCICQYSTQTRQAQSTEAFKLADAALQRWIKTRIDSK